jgi:L-malate glycosyltransferase
MPPSREIVDGVRAPADLRADLAEAERRFAAGTESDAARDAARGSGGSIRLLFLIGGLGPGGAERQAVYLLENLPSRGIRARLACFNGYEEDLRRVARAGVPIDFLAAAGGRLWPLAMLRTLGAIVQRHRIGIVQSFLPTFDILAPVLRIRQPGLRVVTSRRNVDEQLSGRDLRLLRATGRLARAVVGNSRAVVESALRLEGLSAARVRCVPNGFDLPPPVTAEERAAARRRFDLRTDAFVVSYPAHFRRGKGHDHLPAACRAWMAAVPSSVLILAGDAELNDAYRATARRLRASLAADGLADRVCWAGAVREMRVVHAASDASLNLSDFEGMSNSIMESMAFGVPVVATRAGGAEELIHDGDDGCLVACGDPESAARRLVDLALDPATRRRMGERARARLGKEFSVAQMVDRYTDLYRQLTGAGR